MNVSVTMRQAGQSKKMAEAWSSFEERKTILKWYLKFENVVEVQRQWRSEYATEPPTRLTTARICDKCDTHGTVCDVHKGRSGRPRTATTPASSGKVLEQFTHLPQKSNKQCARETGVSRTSIRHTLKTARWNIFIPRLLHALNEDDLIEGCSIVSGSKTWYKRMRSLWGKWFGLMKYSLNWMEQWTDIIVCIGLQQIHTFMWKKKSVYRASTSGVDCH